MVDLLDPATVIPVEARTDRHAIKYRWRGIK
jgi:hypothetical protein